MPAEPKSVRAEITDQFHKILLGELAIADLEKWIYESGALEEDLTTEDHLALLSVDYRRSDALHEVRNIILKYVDLGAFETKKLRRILGDIKDRTDKAFAAIQATYDLYCHGYYFLDNLGLGYGLSFMDYSPRLVPKAKEDLLGDSYPKIVDEADKLLGWLDTGKIVLTGEEGEFGQMGFVDNRPAEEKRPTAYKRVEIPDSPKERSAWDRIEKAWGLATSAEKTVKKAFLEGHPDERVAWTSFKADEPDRFVVGVFYGDTRPPRYAFFGLSKEDGTVSEIVDDGAYRSEVWR